MKSVVLTSVLAFAASGADLSVREIMTRSIANYEKDWMAAVEFTRTEHDVTIDNEGRSKTVDVSQIFPLDGTPYSRLIGKNGHPLTAEEARRESEKYDKAVASRDKETSEQRERRIRKYHQEWEFLHEIPDAFEMKLLGHETLNGRANYLIQLTPKPGYVPKSKNTRMFSDIEGKLWVDEQDLRWTQAEAHVVSTISFGWLLARIGPGARITLRQVKVDGEHWMMKEVDVNGTAKVMLVKNRNLDEKISYSEYKRAIPPAGTAAAKNQSNPPPPAH